MLSFNTKKRFLFLILLAFVLISQSCSYRLKLTTVKGQGIRLKKVFDTQGDFSNYIARKVFRHIKKRVNYDTYNNKIEIDTLDNDTFIFKYGETGISIYQTDSIYADIFLSGKIYPELLKINPGKVQFVMIKNVANLSKKRIHLKFLVFFPGSYTFQNVYVELTNKKISNKNIRKFLESAKVTYVKYGFIEF